MVLTLLSLDCSPDDDAEYDGGLARVFGITRKTFEDERDLLDEALEDEFRKMPALDKELHHPDDEESFMDHDSDSYLGKEDHVSDY